MIAALVLAGAGLRQSQAKAAELSERPTPSGLAVPRYASLKADTVNARAAPSDDSRLLWVYHARGLPVQVVAETADWRRICDPQHGVAWVRPRALAGRRTVMRLRPEPLALHDRADPASRVTAYLAGRALADLDHCDAQGWCRLKAGGVSGWAPAGELWGVADGLQCG